MLRGEGLGALNGACLVVVSWGDKVGKGEVKWSGETMEVEGWFGCVRMMNSGAVFGRVDWF